MADINIYFHDPNSRGLGNSIALCETYNLKNLIKTKTCFTKNHTSSIDVILTNRSKSFHTTLTCETGISDHHHLVARFMRTHLVRLNPKKCYIDKF